MTTVKDTWKVRRWSSTVWNKLQIFFNDRTRNLWPAEQRAFFFLFLSRASSDSESRIEIFSFDSDKCDICSTQISMLRCTCSTFNSTVDWYIDFLFFAHFELVCAAVSFVIVRFQFQIALRTADSIEPNKTREETVEKMSSKTIKRNKKDEKKKVVTKWYRETNNNRDNANTGNW